MLDALLLNTGVHVRFVVRNRLLLAFSLLMAGIFALEMIPMVLMDTSANRFSELQAVTSQLATFAMVFTASLGLFTVSSHLRNRNLKMVFTKPCPPGVWLASVYLSAALVAFVLYVVIALAAAGLSLAWHVPLQPGLAYAALDGFFRAIVWLSFVTTLTVAFHPVVAVMIALFVNDATFYGLKYMIAGAVAANGAKTWLTIATLACDVFYAILPMSQPFDDRTREVYASWRVAGADWLLLMGIGGYAVLVLVLSYAMSLLLLRRKALI